MAPAKKTAKSAEGKSTQKGSSSRTAKSSKSKSSKPTGAKKAAGGTKRTPAKKAASGKSAKTSTGKTTGTKTRSAGSKAGATAARSKSSTGAKTARTSAASKAKTTSKKATASKTRTAAARATASKTKTAAARATASKTKTAAARATASKTKTAAARATASKTKTTSKAKTTTKEIQKTRVTAATTAKPTLEKLIELGREVMGIEGLRPGQAEAFEHILAGRDVLAVMPTGSGKSLLYQLPSLVLPGLTVVVSPLIALIKDQIDKMKALGVAVCRVDSTVTIRQRREMEKLARAAGGKLLLTTPERMADPEFRVFLRECAEGVGVSLFVVDEAHCVSQWGHDFRPSYLGLRKALEDLGRPPVLGTTATAPPHVREDILHQLGMEDAKIVSTTFDRPNLHYEVIAVPGDDDKNRVLVTLLKKLPRPGIVYCATVKAVEQLYEKLYRHGIPVAKYHGRLTKKVRDGEQMRFMAKKSDLVMIATNAFGLGVDKRDIRYVLHYHVPGSLEQYAQEAGRGGRDDKPARCVLLFSPDDIAIQEYFLKGTYPTRRQVRAVFNTLTAWADHDETPPTAANLALASRVSVSRTRTVLSLLKDEKFVVEKEGGLFELPEPAPDPMVLNDKAKQYEARRIADRQRLDALLEYVGTPGCRSQVILGYMGEEDPPECGRCDNCLRSKEAALAAAREAYRLEDGLVRRLQAEDAVDGVPEKRRVIRARVIRIDEPREEAGKGEQAAGEEASAPKNGERPRAEARRDQKAEKPSDEAELARLAAEQRADDEYEDDEYEDDEYEDDEYEDDEYEDDEYEDDDDDDYDVDEIEKTAAALAEEGLELEDAEITILARKRVPKPPKKKRSLAAEEEPPKKKRRRRRRRRRKKNTLPPKSAFTSPVLVKEGNSARERGERDRSAPAPQRSTTPAPGSGPLVEYVRGPMRINMTPVASATPNDVAPQARKGKKKRRRSAAAQPGPPPADSAGPPRKKRRRRRRRRKKGGGVESEDGSITFFSVDESNSARGPNGEGAANGSRKRRRRRRRRGSGKSKKQGAANTAPNQSPSKSDTEFTDA